MNGKFTVRKQRERDILLLQNMIRGAGCDMRKAPEKGYRRPLRKIPAVLALERK